MLLVDPLGRVWPADRETVQRLFGTNLPPQVVTRFASRNMGWILVCHAGEEAIINGRRGRVTQQAVAATAYLLADLAVTRARILELDDARVVLGLQRIIAALERLTLPVDEGRAAHLQRATGPDTSPFGGLASQLAAQGVLSLPLEELRMACDRIFGGRYTLATATGPGRPIRIVGMGTKYTHFNRTFFDRAVGLRFEDGPDVAYGKWIADTMADALNSLTTHFGEVDAEVRYAKSPLRIRYDRMIVPFANERGERFVLSTSNMRNDIDLRSRSGEP